MRTVILVLIMAFSSACGQVQSSASAEAEAVEQKKETSLSCWLDGGKTHTLELPNDCNDTKAYCILEGEAYLYSNGIKTKITTDSCQHRALTQAGAFQCYGWGCI